MTGQQLKNSILQMAVQGKLVPQDPNDEPASVLLERIRKEKEQLIKDGKIKKEKNPSIIFRGADNLPYEKVGNNDPVCIADEVPFDIPDSWEWAKIETISMPIGNKNNQIRSKEVLPTGKISVVSQGKDLIDGYCNDVSKKIDVLPLVMFGDHTRNVKYIDFEFVIGADGTKFHKILSCNSEYIYYWMLYAAETLRNRGYARHYTLLKECFIPLPPLQEQVRIVSKIKAILPLVEKYGCEENKRVSLDSAFPNLLKKSILQEAVQGKLVPQDPADEPASILLDRIRAEKEQLIKAGKIKRDKHESVIFRRDNSHYEKRGSEEVCIDDEIPFEIPDTWEWCRIGSLLQVNPRNNLSDDTDAGFVPMVLIKDGFNNEHSFEERKWGKIKSGFTHFANNDVIVAKITPCFQNRKSAVIANLPNGIGAGTTELHVLRDVTSQLCMQYILLLFKTNEFIKNGVKNFSGTAGQQRIGKDFISNYLIPLPPVKEQERIVNSVLKVFSRVNSLAD